MALKLYEFYWCVAVHCVFQLLITANCSKLNVPRILMPYNHEEPFNFTLKIHDGGCYKWSCSREEIATIEADSLSDCTSEANVFAVSRSTTRQTAIVFAEHVGTGFTLRCDVIVDDIERLEIVTTTREVYVEESPEVFEVRAYDDQGNEFSTLEGLEFIWDLQTATDQEAVIPAQTVLRFMTFGDSLYEAPPAIVSLEKKNKQGYMVLIEGRQTGLARVSVRLAHPSYKHVQTISVNLMVIANLILDPADVYMLPHTSVTYTVFQLTQGHKVVVEIPSSQYYLQVVDKDIAELDDNGLSVLALTQGSTEIHLRDTNMQVPDVIKHPTANLHVVEPSYLTISILPNKNPVILRGNNYFIVVDVYDKGNNQIYLADNVVIETVIPDTYFDTQFSTSNGSYAMVVPIKIGQVKVHASLVAVETNDRIVKLSPILKTSLTVDIFEPLAVLPSQTILPWDPVTRPNYSVQLKAIGGSGAVVWSSSNNVVALVDQMGLCRTRDIGSAIAVAAMTLNSFNKAAGEVHVLEVFELAVIASVVETPISVPLAIHVAAFSTVRNKRMAFHSCNKLPFVVETVEAAFEASQDIKPTNHTESCASVEVIGHSPGFTRVHIRYKGSRGDLVASTVVSAYRPLYAKNPLSGETVLAIGSSRLILFEGGPLPWVAKLATYNAVVSDTKKVELEILPWEGKQQQDLYVVRVICRDLGEVDVTLTVSNKPSTDLPHPVKEMSSVKVFCALPDLISLQAMVKRPTTAQSPCPASYTMAIAHCYKPLELEVSVLDIAGRNFDNISSLQLTWNISNSTLASISNDAASTEQLTKLHGHTFPISAMKELTPNGISGEITVGVRLSGYQFSPVEPRFVMTPLTASLLVRLVSDAIVDPSFVVVFNHKDNLLDLSVTGGSGHYELQSPQQKIMKMKYVTADHILKIRPVADGQVSVTLVDVCLESDKPATATIRVSSVSSLELVVLDRLEVGDTVEAQLTVKDFAGFQIPVQELMNLQTHPQGDIIDVAFHKMTPDGRAIYHVFGHHVGDTTLRMSAASATEDTMEVYSAVRAIQVFSPLTVHPKNITLIIGAVYQVETKGGPYPDVSIDFIVENDTLASISSTGIVTALSLGTTILTARAISVDSESGKTVIYSKDTVIINVIPLERITIHCPLKRLETGTSMPLYAFGADSHQSLISYATATPPLIMEWIVNNLQVASLSSLFSGNGLADTKENNGMVTINAITPGRVTVTLQVKVSMPSVVPNYQIYQNIQLMDKVEIKVFESLKLVKPVNDSVASLLLSPNSETKIVTNREGDGKLSYSLTGISDIVTVNSNGLVKSGSQTGQTTVLVTLEEQFGITQSFSLLVEVKKVKYIQPVVKQFMSVIPGVTLVSVPVGSSFHLQLTYHDNRGRAFHATNCKPIVRPSRFDCVSLSHSSNDSLLAKIRSMGQTVVHIWDENNADIATYVRIDTASGDLPEKMSVSVGTHLCFHRNILAPDGTPGHWDSQGGSLTLDSVTGFARTELIGRSVVTFSSSSIVSKVDVTVTPVSKIRLTPPLLPLSNGLIDDSQFALVQLSGQNDSPSILNCWHSDIGNGTVPFTCLASFIPSVTGVDVKNVFVVNAVYLPDIGFACEIRFIKGPLLALASEQTSVALEAVVINRGQQQEVRSGPIALTFHSAPVAETSQVALTNEAPIAEVVLHGLPDVLAAIQVVPNEQGLLESSLGPIEKKQRILKINAEKAFMGGSVTSLPMATILEMYSPLTRHFMQVKVNVGLVGDGIFTRTLDDSFSNLLISSVTPYEHVVVRFVITIAFFVCLFIGYKAVSGPGYRQTNQVGVFASSPAPAPYVPVLTPARMSPRGDVSGNLELRHRSPVSSPHLWSIDQQPVYGAPQRRNLYDSSALSGN